MLRRDVGLLLLPDMLRRGSHAVCSEMLALRGALEGAKKVVDLEDEDEAARTDVRRPESCRAKLRAGSQSTDRALEAFQSIA